MKLCEGCRRNEAVDGWLCAECRQERTEELEESDYAHHILIGEQMRKLTIPGDYLEVMPPEADLFQNQEVQVGAEICGFCLAKYNNKVLKVKTTWLTKIEKPFLNTNELVEQIFEEMSWLDISEPDMYKIVKFIQINEEDKNLYKNNHV